LAANNRLYIETGNQLLLTTANTHVGLKVTPVGTQFRFKTGICHRTDLLFT